MHDIIVVGGGAAGMTAALYAQRNGKSALVIEKNGRAGHREERVRRADHSLAQGGELSGNAADERQ